MYAHLRRATKNSKYAFQHNKDNKKRDLLNTFWTVIIRKIGAIGIIGLKQALPRAARITYNTYNTYYTYKFRGSLPPLSHAAVLLGGHTHTALEILTKEGL